MDSSQSTDLPETAVPLRITHGERELYHNEPDIEAYLYIVIDDQIVERCPRAEPRCTEGL